LWSGPRLAFARRRGPLLEAGSQLPFPLRRGEFHLTRRHGAGDSTRAAPLMFTASLPALPKSIVNPRSPQDPQAQLALGKAIRELRNKKGASQESLANEAGITPNMLSLIERGEGNPSWVTLRGIAAALGIKTSELARLAEKHQ
jgi:DNA-binding XRE family transcriptional regulator